jgi:hypothetical protein
MRQDERGEEAGADAALERLGRMRRDLYWSFGSRRDELFEACDALACRPGPLLMLADLSLEPEHRRGHGALYDGLNCGDVLPGRMRRTVAGVPLPSWPDGRIRLAVDVSPWLRPDAETSPDRAFCHVRGRGGSRAVPGWPYSWVVALERGRTSWSLPLDAVRLRPGDDATAVTAAQLREVAERLIAAGHWKDGDPLILLLFDAGYELARLAYLLRDLPVEVCGRIRSNRVMYGPGGERLALKEPETHPEPAVTAVTETERYGTARALAWERQHQKLSRQGGWKDCEGDLPVIEGTLVCLRVERLPGDRKPDPVWLWSSRGGTVTEEDVNLFWQSYLRRFDIEHFFRFLKQQLGWAAPRLRDPAAADRWTWLVLAAFVQLYLARDLAADLRMPWQPPCPPGRLTPARVRRGFRYVRAALPVPAGVPRPSRPGPGRPAGAKNKKKAPRPPIGKTLRKTVRKTKAAA